MIDLYQIYKESQQGGQGEGGLHLASFLATISSTLLSIQPTIAGKDDIKDQEFSKKEIASLLNFFIYLAGDTNVLASLLSPGANRAKKDIISKFFVDDTGEPQLDMALKKISSRIAQLLEFSSEESKISKELFDEINQNIDSYAHKTTGEEGFDQHAASSPLDISLEIKSSASHSDDKHKNIDCYIEEYKKILEKEEEFAKKLNEEEQKNLSPKKYSGIGASVEMISNEEGKITGFKVLSVVENSHAQDIGLKEDNTLQLNTPVNEDEINAIVDNIRNLDLSNLYIEKDGKTEKLEILETPSPRRQFFSTEECAIKMISADEAGIETVARKLDFDGASGETPGPDCSVISRSSPTMIDNGVTHFP